MLNHLEKLNTGTFLFIKENGKITLNFVVRSLSHVQLFATWWTAARQA